jgi:hypothetical protein
MYILKNSDCSCRQVALKRSRLLAGGLPGEAGSSVFSKRFPVFHVRKVEGI